jgi:hypothetical protein
MPKFENPAHVPYAEIAGDIDRIFELFDYIDWLQLVGGEVFLYKDIGKVLEHAYRYKARFGKMIIMTNATVFPRGRGIAALKMYGQSCQVQISDYGALSSKKERLVQALEQNGISYVIKPYYEDDQHCGGWIDNTRLEPFAGDAEELERLTARCPQVVMQNMHAFRGKLYRCSNSCFLSEAGVIRPYENDIVCLYGKNHDIDEKRRILDEFYRSPRASCRICRWYECSSGNERRYPAAEQIGRKGK